MSDDEQMLFAERDLPRVLDGQRNEALNEIARMPPADLLAWDEAELCAELVARYSVTLPVLHRAAGYLDRGVEDAPVTLRGFKPQWGFTEVATKVVLVVPFEGDAPVFKYRATSHTANPPWGEYTENELRLTWSGAHNGASDAAAITENFDRRLDLIEQHLVWSRSDINQYHQQLQEAVAGAVRERRQKLLADRELEMALGYPLRKRPDAAAFEVPINRRRITPVQRPPAGDARQPEFFLADEPYEEALGVLRNGRNLLERSPTLTATLDEERIRDLLLFLLNGAFEGAALGEVFNRAGKTDILIRVGDQNVFVAECKIWRGAKTVRAGLDQLLGYLAWRDTKAALILLIRDGEPTDVIKKAVSEIENHPNVVSSHGTAEDGGRYDFVLHANGDASQVVRLALLPFVLLDRLPSS